MKVRVIGAGLAGCEAAWYLANKGINVDLYEMRPIKSTGAHKTDLFAELVCSNSLRADGLLNGVGLLKAEMEMLGSIIMRNARKNAVKAGGALAVDRTQFSLDITDEILYKSCKKLEQNLLDSLPNESDIEYEFSNKFQYLLLVMQ